ADSRRLESRRPRVAPPPPIMKEGTCGTFGGERGDGRDERPGGPRPRRSRAGAGLPPAQQAPPGPLRPPPPRPPLGQPARPLPPGLAAGVYHYAPHEHALGQRRGFGPEEAERLAAALPPGSFLVGLSSVHWREAWKYGARAFRYCQHDLGHALAAVAYAAACL